MAEEAAGATSAGSGGAQGAGRPQAFPMQIQGGMLEALGINMYTSIGKCLVEFIANAYDSDSPTVEVAIPYDRIGTSRKAARAAAREAAAAAGHDGFSVLVAPLPDEVEIVITDAGHGMSPEDVRTKFMPINRKRRIDDEGRETRMTSESGRRFVMGRKGLGKLAGFGAAEIVEIRTKRRGETFATTFVMELEKLRNSHNVGEVEIPATYEEGLPAEDQGTTVRLRRLKCDAVKQSPGVISETIASAFFGVEPADFRVAINGEHVRETSAAYEFTFAPDAGSDGFARQTFHIEDVGPVHFDYVVKFRAREKDPSDHSLAFGSLPAAKRGARIYCNNRLAAGPSLLALKTGMHNFYATDYMECLVRADDIDRRTIDLINTNRTQLREDNEVVQTLIESVTAVMAKAIVAHAAWRERKVEATIDAKVSATPDLQWIGHLPATQRRAARNLLKVVAFNHDVDSPEFRELAPNLLNAVTAQDVMMRLIELRTDPRDLAIIALRLKDLGDVERGQVLSHYRGRRDAITAVAKLAEDGELAKAGDPRTEKRLHALLKANPWLVRPDLSRHVASDVAMTTTLSKLAAELKVDGFAKPHVPVDGADATRPDLVFLLGDTPNPYVVTVVELKSPTIPMDYEHLRQLEGYMRQIKAWISNELRRPVDVRGMLVGRMPEPNARAAAQAELLAHIAEYEAKANWEVVGLQRMLERTRTVHLEMIEALESELADEAPASAAPLPAAMEAADPGRVGVEA